MNDHIGKPVEPELLYLALLKWLPAGGTREDNSATAAIPVTSRSGNPQADGNNATILSRLAAIPKMNTERPIAALRGNASRYLEFMHRFVETHAGDMPLMASQLATGDREAARRLAHALKGSGATLGAEGLAASAARLEVMLRDGSAPPAEQAMRAEMDAIARAFQEKRAPDFRRHAK